MYILKTYKTEGIVKIKGKMVSNQHFVWGDTPNATHVALMTDEIACLFKDLCNI